MLQVFPTKSFSLEIDSIAADKSISHRCAIFSLLCKSPSIITNYLLGEDTLHTLHIAKNLGLEVVQVDSNTMKFIPPTRILEPSCVLDCGNAGTGMRLYAGLLAGQEGYFVLSGDKYLCARPMNRVIVPLRDIGAEIYSRANGFAPLSIIGTKLDGFEYMSQISSAQVKSAMILAALNAKDSSVYTEQILSRDHTERMLQGMGADIQTNDTINGHTISIKPLSKPLESIEFAIPADPSSAFFFALAAAIVPNSEVMLKNIILNKTRIEAFNVLKKMGAKVEFETTDSTYEQIGNIYVAHSKLQGIVIDKNISWLIDELPALGIAMALANGVSEVKNAKELRVKETDRITALLSNLRKMGIECEEKEDGYKIYGGDMHKACIESFGDHRIAMSFAIAGLIASVKIQDDACIRVSFPNFTDILSRITRIQKDS